MIKITPDNEFHAWFDSLDEMHAELPAMAKAGPNFDEYQRVLATRGEREDRRWFGMSIDELHRAMSHGSEALLGTLQPMIEQIRQALALGSTAAVNVEVRRRKMRRSDTGDTLDMGRVWNGQLDTAWSRPVRFPKQSSSQRYCTIFTDCGMIGDLHADNSLWRAAMSQCLVEVLTRMGYHTEVWCGDTGYGLDAYERKIKREYCGVKIKAFNQPLNEARLAIMMHAGFFRSELFSLWAGAAPFRINSGFGRPFQKGLVMPLRKRLEAGERVFRVDNVESLEGAINVMTRILDELRDSDKEAA